MTLIRISNHGMPGGEVRSRLKASTSTGLRASRSRAEMNVDSFPKATFSSRRSWVDRREPARERRALVAVNPPQRPADDSPLLCPAARRPSSHSIARVESERQADREDRDERRARAEDPWGSAAGGSSPRTRRRRARARLKYGSGSRRSANSATSATTTSTPVSGVLRVSVSKSVAGDPPQRTRVLAPR